MANNKITDAKKVSLMADTDSVFINAGGAISQMAMPDFRTALNVNDEQVLGDLAFYIDVNKASSLGSTRVDVGGNMNMRTLWENAAVSVIMDASGNYCELNRDDNRYTAEGDYLLNADGTVASAFAHGDFMKIIPQTYGRVQTVKVGSTTILRLWLSLVPLPGGYIIPRQVVGKFKASTVSGKLRSLPGMVPASSQNINSYWDMAQLRSKNHGLANLDFRNHLLFHMMSKYAYRDSQNCKSSDGTLVWGVGLDGTESTASGESTSSVGFTRQSGIKTGHTLSLGDYDGKASVTDSIGNTCHGVNVCGFENPWGQYTEIVQGLCSVGTDVYCWRHNWLPTGTPTAASFDAVEHVVLTRPIYAQWGMNIIAGDKGQGVYMILNSAVSGISYGDSYSYDANGQLWIFGGNSYVTSGCGLAYANSVNVWSYSDVHTLARIAYYGGLTKVTSSRFKELGT